MRTNRFSTREDKRVHKASGAMPMTWLRHTVLASVAALSLLGVSVDAQALALGAISVQSALGEPLHAEIEIPEMTSEQASSLSASIATQKEFQASGVDYSAALKGAQVSLQHRANGQPYLRITGRQAINEPFVNIVINATWANGHLRRDYTALLNPPGRAAIPAVTPAESAATATMPAQTAAAPIIPSAAEQVRPAAPRKAPLRRERASIAAPAAETPERRKVTVRRGDTASGIVHSARTRGVSLDQQLIALLHANPRAFIDGNVNLVKAGAVVRIPTAAEARATSRTEARKLVLAQTQDFHTYRQRLASNTPTKAPASTVVAHAAEGAVQPAHVKDEHAAAESPDQLKVSKAEAKDSSATQVAQSREEHAQSDRVAELNKNIQDLSQLEKQTQAADSGAAPGNGTQPAEAAANQDTKASAGPAATESKSGDASSAAPAGTSKAGTEPQNAAAPQSAGGEQAPATATPPAASQPQTASPSVAVKANPPPTPAAAPAWYDDLTDSPSTLGLLAALIVLLVGYGLYRKRRHKSGDAAGFGGMDGDADAPKAGGTSTPTRTQTPVKTSEPSQPTAAHELAGAAAATAADGAATFHTVETQADATASAVDLNLDLNEHDGHAPGISASDDSDVTDFQPTTLSMRLPELETKQDAPQAPTQPHHLMDDAAGDPDVTDFQETTMALHAPSSGTTASTPQGQSGAISRPVLDDLTLPDLSFSPPKAAPAPVPDRGTIDFDPDTLTVEPASHGSPATSIADAAGALMTKLTLAQEFLNIGDTDGARSLAQEVIAGASGDLKQRAEKFLTNL